MRHTITQDFLFCLSMLTLRLTITIAALAICLQSCKRTFPDKVEVGKGDTFIRYKYHDNGAVRLSTQFLLQDDSSEKPVGYEKTFYPSGKLKGYSLNVPATQEGNYTMYYQAGRYYFENGNIAGKFNLFDSKLVGEQVIYYPNGKLQSVRVFDGKGKILFLLVYGLNGKMRKLKGYPYMY